jgi:hypothetical protein
VAVARLTLERFRTMAAKFGQPDKMAIEEFCGESDEHDENDGGHRAV